LPQILFTLMHSPNIDGVIVRGDLAVESGHARLTELQLEILWIAEAAHLPVIWATRCWIICSGPARRRAEITDPAMGVGSACVTLNEGVHVLDAIAATTCCTACSRAS
jgi:pyruvate kinase